MEAPQSESPKPINGQWKERGNFKWQAPQHLISIAELSLCVPLSHWYFEEMHCSVTRALRSNTHDVIEVVSLQAADDPVLGRVSSHACFGKLHFGRNNAKLRLLLRREEKNEKSRDAERNRAEFLSCYDVFYSICLRVFVTVTYFLRTLQIVKSIRSHLSYSTYTLPLPHHGTICLQSAAVEQQPIHQMTARHWGHVMHQC